LIFQGDDGGAGGERAPRYFALALRNAGVDEDGAGTRLGERFFKAFAEFRRFDGGRGVFQRFAVLVAPVCEEAARALDLVEVEAGEQRVVADGGEMRLDRGSAGTPLLPRDTVLLEIKTAGAMPLWLASLVSEYEIRQTSFSASLILAPTVDIQLVS